MLWNIIRDWFVNYIFGGYNSSGQFVRGLLIGSTGSDQLSTTSFNVNVGNYCFYIGDWLSTTFTIIVLVLLIIFLIKATIYLFKFVGGLFKW